MGCGSSSTLDKNASQPNTVAAAALPSKPSPPIAPVSAATISTQNVPVVNENSPDSSKEVAVAKATPPPPPPPRIVPGNESVVSKPLVPKSEPTQSSAKVENSTQPTTPVVVSELSAEVPIAAGDNQTSKTAPAGGSDNKQKTEDNAASQSSVSVIVSETISPSSLSSTLASQSNDDSLQVVPLAGFVLKTRRMSTNQKVFVNIFYHGIVGSLLSTPAKQQVDKKGQACSVYDIIMPEAHYLDCVGDEIIRDQACAESISLINSVYDDDLSTVFLIPKMKRGFVGDTIESIDIPPESINVRYIDILDEFDAKQGQDATQPSS